ncbi:MAG: immune inhibitor A [Phototrophicaceae bacterium]
MIKRLLISILFCSLSLSLIYGLDDTILLAIDPDLFPSYALVTETQLPLKNPEDLARRLQNVSEVIIQPHTSGREIGAIETFNIASVGGSTVISTHLSAIGENVYVWIEDTLIVNEDVARNLANRFDSEVYQFVRNLWGSEPPLGIDNESRVHIVITSRLRQGIGGYFSSSNAYPAMISPNSNEYDMLILGDFILISEFTDVGISSSAHEFQHLIHHYRDGNEDNWLNEGLATFTEYQLGLDASLYLLDAFAQAPQTSLTMWGLGENRQAEYGSAMMFMLYLNDRFGLEMVQQVASDRDNGLYSINNILQANNHAPVDIIFADWVLANVLRQDSGAYGYQSLADVNAMRINPIPASLQADTLNQYATQFYVYQNQSPSLSLSLQMSDTVALIPTQATSGQHFWYSLRGDNSNSRLTRAFDLREVQSADLSFNIWYDLETEWDYAYISVSADNGQTWQVQETSLMTSNNSNQRAYAMGYTGQSEGWQEQNIVLDSYAGQEILVRFEMVTDDAVNNSGIALDDMRLNAIAYSDDFETADDAWVAEGWIRTDNRLPQRAWVQVIENSPEPIIHRFLADGAENWELSLSDSTTSVTIAVSPFAPMTSETASYTLQVE